MRVTTSKSKNAESFYISKGYVNDKGVSTSVIIRKLGTLKDLLPEHGPTRDDVMVWAKEQARIETLKYKREKEEKQIKLTFHADRPLDYDKQVFYRGGYLFLQSIYYQLQINKICRKLKQKHKFKYDINAILSDMIYARILEPRSKRSSYKAASEFLENHPINFTMYTEHWMSLEQNAISFRQNFTKTAISLGQEMIRSFIMIVQTTTLKSSRKMETKSMEKAKNTDQIRSFKWVCLWMATASPLLFLPLQEMQTNRHPSNHWKKRYLESLDARNSFTAVMQAWDPNLSVNTTIWGNVLIS